MEQFTINTAQNISIEQPLASIGERILANLMDYAIMAAYYFVTLFVTGLIRNHTFLILFSMPVLFYHLIFELSMNGQSPGKKVMNIRVFSENGSSASFLSIFIRWVFRLVDVSLFFGSIATVFIVGTRKNQRLGDLAGRTILLRTRQKKMSGSMYINLPENYTLQYPEVSNLSEKDLNVVREVVGFLTKTNKNDDSQLYALKTKTMLTKKMGIESSLKPDLFLVTLLKDYNYIHSQHNSP
jgi:uncharacterized RDD family membrane protein YckC